MAFCKQCGAALPADVAFCPFCGAPIDKEALENAAAPVEAPVAPVEAPVEQPAAPTVPYQAQPTPPAAPQKKKSRAGLIIGVIAGVLVLLLVATGLVWWFVGRDACGTLFGSAFSRLSTEEQAETLVLTKLEEGAALLPAKSAQSVSTNCELSLSLPESLTADNMQLALISYITADLGILTDAETGESLFDVNVKMAGMQVFSGMLTLDETGVGIYNEKAQTYSVMPFDALSDADLQGSLALVEGMNGFDLMSLSDPIKALITETNVAKEEDVAFTLGGTEYLSDCYTITPTEEEWNAFLTSGYDMLRPLLTSYAALYGTTADFTETDADAIADAAAALAKEQATLQLYAVDESLVRIGIESNDAAIDLFARTTDNDDDTQTTTFLCTVDAEGDRVLDLSSEYIHATDADSTLTLTATITIDGSAYVLAINSTLSAETPALFSHPYGTTRITVTSDDLEAPVVMALRVEKTDDGTKLTVALEQFVPLSGLDLSGTELYLALSDAPCTATWPTIPATTVDQDGLSDAVSDCLGDLF